MRSLLILLFVFTIFSCKEDKIVKEIPIVEEEISTFYFIRHAEKDRSDLDDADPQLIQEGLGRAMQWAEVFDGIQLHSIFSTDYARTSMTAAPTSIKQNVDVVYYNFGDIDINQFKMDHKNQNTLIVGHSNTTPDFVNKMLGEDIYYQMDDYDNGSLFIVQIVNGKATSQKLNINPDFVVD